MVGTLHRLRFVAWKLLRMGLLLVGVSAVAFFLLTASPIDPVKANVGQAAMGAMSAAQIEKLELYWGAGQPPLARYARWAGDFIRGDMGTSLLYRQPVSQVIGTRLASSLGVLLCAWIFSGVLGFALGVLAGVNRGRLVDKLVQGYCFFLSSTPAFFLALLLLLVFAVQLKILPIGFSVPVGASAAAVTWADRLAHAVLPALTLSLTGIAHIALHTRAKMAELMERDFILYARARGERTLSIALGHGLRNIFLPTLTLQFASLGELLGGSVVVEQVFSYPGLGQATVAAGLKGDLPLLLGITVCTAALVFFGNLVCDLLYGVVDPRIRRGAAQK